MSKARRHFNWADIGFMMLLLGAIFMRFHYYESPTLSIATHDTGSYVIGGKDSFLSPSFYTGNRPPTMKLVYSLLGSSQPLSTLTVSSPGDFIQYPLTRESGLSRIPLFQALLSIVAWSLLALVIYSSLSVKSMKLLGAIIVFTFGLSPQVVEWDYVLLSESISNSLFIFLLALSLALSLHLTGIRTTSRKINTLMIIFWYLVLILWVFTRDTNAYFLLILIPIPLILIILGKGPWGGLSRSHLGLVAVSLIGIFWAHNVTMELSGRWASPLANNLITYVLNDKDHLAFFESRGLPITQEVLKLRGASLSDQSFYEIDYFMDWLNQNGTSTYLFFLLSDPTWTANTFAENSIDAFTENRQVFFLPNSEVTPTWLVALGDMLNPLSYTVLFVFGFQLILLGALAAVTNNDGIKLVTVFLFVFFLGELGMLFVSTLGDASNIIRHSLGAVMPIRLSIWLLPLYILESIYYLAPSNAI